MQTAASFELLQVLQMLSVTAKSSVYDFYRALEKLTNNTGIDVPPSRYPQLMRMLLQWRHLKMMKRGGRVTAEENGIRMTTEGQIAVKCPSCPWPDINLLSGWQNVSAEDRYGEFLQQ